MSNQLKSLSKENVLISRCQEWFELAERLGWKSYDPFDLLLSPYFRKIRSSSPFIARALIQLGKRLGSTTRKLLQIQPHEEAKTFSDFLSAAIRLSRHGYLWTRSFVEPLADSLKAKAIQTPNGFGWGLEFPYVSRFVNVPARIPNAYTTANAIRSLLDQYELCNDPLDRELAFLGCQCIIRDLGEFSRNGSTWFQYWPDCDIPAANVQAILASTFVRAGIVLKDINFFDLADRCVKVVLATQRSDGSWYYSEDGRGWFVDGFHTGFILQGLSEYIQDRSAIDVTSVQMALQKGMTYFKDHLITSSNMPRYYSDGKVSSDGQNFAQCIQTLAICATDDNDILRAYAVWKNMLKIHKKISDHTAQRETALGSVTYLRWTIGPAVLATSHLINALLGMK